MPTPITIQEAAGKIAEFQAAVHQIPNGDLNAALVGALLVRLGRIEDALSGRPAGGNGATANLDGNNKAAASPWTDGILYTLDVTTAIAVIAPVSRPRRAFLMAVAASGDPVVVSFSIPAAATDGFIVPTSGTLELPIPAGMTLYGRGPSTLSVGVFS